VIATTEEATITVPGTPPSLNAVGLRSHWAVGRKHKLDWQRHFETALMVAQVPRGMASVLVSGRLEFRQRRRRDEGNFRMLVEKALGDALVNGRWLADDTPEHYRFGTLELVAPTPHPQTVIPLAYPL
jgi:hypothetical protein